MFLRAAVMVIAIEAAVTLHVSPVNLLNVYFYFARPGRDAAQWLYETVLLNHSYIQVGTICCSIFVVDTVLWWAMGCAILSRLAPVRRGGSTNGYIRDAHIT